MRQQLAAQRVDQVHALPGRVGIRHSGDPPHLLEYLANIYRNARRNAQTVPRRIDQPARIDAIQLP
jgi:hypothetical protein